MACIHTTFLSRMSIYRYSNLSFHFTFTSEGKSYQSDLYDLTIIKDERVYTFFTGNIQSR